MNTPANGNGRLGGFAPIPGGAVGGNSNGFGAFAGMFGMPGVKLNPAQNPDPKKRLYQNDVYKDMRTDRNDYMNKAYKLQKNQNMWNGILQMTQSVGTLMSNVFQHVANMKQLELHGQFMEYQHDIARRGLDLEDKKLDVMKDMQGEQLKYQLTVARYQKETAVTVAAIQQKGKTRRVQALAALRGFYNTGKPVSPFQRAMT